jgi:hypothetical protein
MKIGKRARMSFRVLLNFFGNHIEASIAQPETGSS